MRRGTLVADAVTTWLERGEDRPTLVFAVDRAHAKSLQAKFQEAGIATEYIDAFVSREEREEIGKRFHAGTTRVVVNIACLTTGLDWDVRCIVLARPTKSEILFVQIVGRGLRTAEGKADLLILDHSDTHARLGFVDQIHHDQLDDGKPRKPAAKDRREEPLPTPCPSCSFVKPARVRKCPSCGFEPQRQSAVTVGDGELIELSTRRPKAAPTRDDKQAFWSMLLHQARARGYKRGWAAWVYKRKFNVWPVGLNDVLLPPSPEVASYIKASQIRFAKRRAA
jgi:superfamily II DNA or RNA helicase